MSEATKKIFVVDDDEMLSMALEDYLERNSSHEVHLFNTGEECLEHLEEKPDIIILDYNLNSVKRDAANGLIILEAIKKMNNNIKIVMLSSQDATWIVVQTVKIRNQNMLLKTRMHLKRYSRFAKQLLPDSRKCGNYPDLTDSV